MEATAMICIFSTIALIAYLVQDRIKVKNELDMQKSYTVSFLIPIKICKTLFATQKNSNSRELADTLRLEPNLTKINVSNRGIEFAPSVKSYFGKSLSFNDISIESDNTGITYQPN